jgi:CelD/BcsL family acetyltransferase involved in cellulose biosynthesis
MTAPFDPSAVTVAAADLTDAALVAQIDAWVVARPDSNPFQRPAWIKAVERSTGQRASLLLARDPAGRIVGLLPLTHMRSLLFGKAVVSSGFAVDGGILADTDRAADALAQAGWALAERDGCASMELRGGRAPKAEWTLKANSYLGFARPLAEDDQAEL